MYYISMSNSIRDAKIIGYFSLPSPSLAEHNPEAYNNALRDVPAGAGSCSHCGMGIRHHVVIRDAEGQTRYIGTTCAEKVGCDSEALRYRLTSEQREERERRQRASRANLDLQRELANQRRAVRREELGDIIALLEPAAEGNEFYSSLLRQLLDGPLSERQAHFVARLTSATGRKNRKNEDAWYSIIDRCTQESSHEAV